MKTLLLVVIVTVFSIPMSYAEEVSNGVESDAQPIRIIREVR